MNKAVPIQPYKNALLPYLRDTILNKLATRKETRNGTQFTPTERISAMPWRACC